MRYIFISIVYMILGAGISHAENIKDLTARAIGESNPDICFQAEEVCYESSWEKSCISKKDNQFMCLRDYAIAKSDIAICERVNGQEAGRLKRNDCYAQYARKKKDLKSCEILKQSSTPDMVLYESCIYSIQRDSNYFTKLDCLKIKESQRSYFIDCIAGLANQNQDSSLCEEYFSEITKKDGRGDTPVEWQLCSVSLAFKSCVIPT